jgi:hypothetical protein
MKSNKPSNNLPLLNVHAKASRFRRQGGFCMQGNLLEHQQIVRHKATHQAKRRFNLNVSQFAG